MFCVSAVVKARNLALAEFCDTISASVTVAFGAGPDQSTAMRKRTVDPYWNQTFKLYVCVPLPVPLHTTYSPGTQTPLLPALRCSGALVQMGGGGAGVRSAIFSQFSAIFRNFAFFRKFPQFLWASSRNVSAIAICLSALRGCWCPLPWRTTVAEQCFPAPKMIEWFLLALQGHAAMWG